MKEETIKRNIIFIMLIGIEGLAFGLIDWGSVMSDLVYLKYNNKLLISIISANIGIAKLIATLICIHINNYKKPNKIFLGCVSLCAIGAILIGITYNIGWIILFGITYILEYTIMELFSGYHYAYTYNSLPDEIATQVHSKRIAIFKITFMLGIGIAGFLTVKYINNTVSIVCALSSIVFLILIGLIVNVKNEPKSKEKDTIPLKQKLDLRKYTKYYKTWACMRLLGKFALSSLVVLISMIAIDSNLDIASLKIVKTSLWFFSAFGFWISAYLIKNSVIVRGDVICKILMAVLIVISFFYPYAIFAIIVLNGVLEPLNTMSNFVALQKENDGISIAQKELIIKLFGYFAAMLSSYILLNINVKVALSIIIIALIFSAVMEAKLYNKMLEKNYEI